MHVSPHKHRGLGGKRYTVNGLEICVQSYAPGCSSRTRNAVGRFFDTEYQCAVYCTGCDR